MLGCDVKGGVHRWLTLVTGMVESLCFPYDWASLVVVLKDENYYGWLCVNGTGLNGTANGTQVIGELEYGGTRPKQLSQCKCT